VARSFGRSTVTGPAVVFTVVGQYPLREPGRASGASNPPLVAGPAKELGNLGLHRRLHDQTRAQSGDVFQYLAQLAAGAEQHVDLATDLLRRGYW